MDNRPAFTRLELLIVILIIALLLAVLVPSLLRARELSRREKCATHLKQVGTAFYVAPGPQESEWWHADWPSWKVYRGHLDLGIEYTQAIGSYRSLDLSTYEAIPDKLSCTRGFWHLVRESYAELKQFNCPASNDILSDEKSPKSYFDFGVGTITGPASAQQASLFWRQVSYGLQVPFGKLGRPNSDRDQRMILAADKGPFGANIDAGLPAPPDFPQTSLPTDWHHWNSPNHNGQGQTVLFADSHAEFWTSPVSPSFSDNIYTRWSDETSDEFKRSTGLAPAPGKKLVPASNTDTLIYP